mmetsp:Transcript_12268/g.14813  ORF Transcript_12268/g.14813 Transcript_12268/m.14813 type:complete len:267 (+) Transcript_12268:76-876(+)
MNCNDEICDMVSSSNVFLNKSPPKIVSNKINVSFNKFARTLDDVFSEEECSAIIKVADETGFNIAGIGGTTKQEVISSIRSSERILCRDEMFANEIWNRVKEHIPIVWNGRPVLGLNELLRFLRYKKGDFFAPHVDGNYCRKGTDNLSLCTLQLYLSNANEWMGGATTFCAVETENKKYEAVSIFPQIGRIVLFDHKILHEGSIVHDGIKYTIRTDVEYGPPSFSSQFLELIHLGSSPIENRKTLCKYLCVILIFAFLGLVQLLIL